MPKSKIKPHPRACSVCGGGFQSGSLSEQFAVHQKCDPATWWRIYRELNRDTSRMYCSICGSTKALRRGSFAEQVGFHRRCNVALYDRLKREASQGGLHIVHFKQI